MTGDAKSGPLAGIRVIELARVLAGPWAGQLLADLGADVIKIENPDGGDETRHWGPPFVTGENGDDLSAAYFHAANRGKRSIAVDIATADGQETVQRLVESADVLIENFKVGGLKKYGLDRESLTTLNPRLVYCSITGFGQTGPYADHAGYDFIIQGMSGFMSVTGERDGMPMKAGVAITDILTGLYAVSAIEAALIRALKTGAGSHVDIALFEVMSASLANQTLNYLVSGKAPARLGNAHPNIAPYQVVETRDGHVIIAVGNDRQFRRLCTVLGLYRFAHDPRFETNPARVANRDELTATLVATTRTRARDDLVKQCENNGVPVGPINTIEDMFADPQIIERGLRIDRIDGEGNRIPGVRAPVFMDGFAQAHGRPSPRLGEHTAEILAELAAQRKDPA
jgi:crotonobetainyl-CoA:carnitine CoA-transferase CaiB-like acyl-CoA transferase